MIAESKLLLPPLVGITIVVANIISDLPEAARLVLDLAALAILFAGFLVVGKLRAEAAAAKGAAEAWELERNAERAKSERLERELADVRTAAKEQEDLLRIEVTELRVEVTKLEARPTLETVTAQLDQIRMMMTSMAEGVQQVVQSHRPLPEGGTS